MAAGFPLGLPGRPTSKMGGTSIADLLRAISAGGSGLSLFADALGGGDQAPAYAPPAGDHSMDAIESARAGTTQDASGATQLPPTLLQMLMAQAMGSGSRSSVRAATAPQRALINALQGQLGQSAAQTKQNQADIGSWYGQLGGMYAGNARAAARGGKKASKQTARLGKGLLAGVADPNVARSVGNTAARQAGYLRVAGNEAANFARNQSADAGREAAYQQLVQQRLGMQQQADIRTQLAQAQAAKVAAKSSANSGDMSQLLQVLGLVGKNPQLDAMLGVPSEDGGFSLDQGSALQSALGSVDVFKDADKGGGTVGGVDLEGIIKKMYGAANARGLDINSPEVKNAIRSYIASHIMDQYNELPGPDYTLNNGSFITAR